MFSFIKRAFRNAISGLEKPAQWFIDAIANVTSDSGIKITGRKALQLPAVWYAVSKISGHVAQLPLEVRRDLDPGSEPAKTHPAYRLVKTRPNPMLSAAQMWETIMVHCLIWGNAKIYVVRGPDGQPNELIPISAENSVTLWDSGRKYHVVTLEQEEPLKFKARQEVRANRVVIPDSDVVHVPGLGIDGLCGLQTFEIQKNSIGLGLAGEKAVNKDLAQGSRPSLLLQAPPKTFKNEEDAKKFLHDFNKWHSGLDNIGKAGMLRENMEVITVNQERKDWVGGRKFQRQEIALIFLLEAILGDDESISYNSMEQKNLAYLSNCLMRFLIKIEQECDEKLLSNRQKQRSTHFFKFNTAALLRSDFKSTMDALSVAINARIMSPNEARAKLDMNPYAGGDKYENPAISPGGPGESESNSRDDEGDSSNASRNLILAHIEHRIGIESKRALQAAGNQSNYINWLDNFYDKFTNVFEDAVERMGGDREIGTRHCQQSKDQLLEIAGSVTLDGLADAIAEATDSWPDRAQDIADQILNGELIDA